MIFVGLMLFSMANCELRFLFSIFRHGARSPVDHVLDEQGNDPWGEHWDAPGELTPVGSRMHYILGMKNRDTYKEFLPKHFDTSVYISSSDYNRTMQSVQSQMQGLYPPYTGPSLTRFQRKTAYAINDYKGKLEQYQKSAGRYSIKKGVQTFPVHLFPRDDPMFNFFYHPFRCAAYAKMIGENQHADKVKKWFKGYVAEYGDILTSLLGKSKEELESDYMYTFSLMDAFISDLQDGRELNKAKEAGLDLQAFNKTAYDFSELDILDSWNGDKEGFFARWTGSLLLPEVIQWMEHRIEADAAGDMGYHGFHTPRFGIFSTHDVTVGSMLTVLNIAFGTEKMYTPYACDMIMELHHTGDAHEESNYEVHLEYNGHHLKTVPFPEFREKLQAIFYTPEQIQEKCQFGAPKEPAQH